MYAENLIQFPTQSLATIAITKEVHLFKSLAVPPKGANSVSRELYVQALNMISGPEQRMITFLLNQGKLLQCLNPSMLLKLLMNFSFSRSASSNSPLVAQEIAEWMNSEMLKMCLLLRAIVIECRKRSGIALVLHFFAFRLVNALNQSGAKLKKIAH